MEEINDYDQSEGEEVIPDGKQSKSKSTHMVITQPSEDLNRYPVDKCNPPTKEAKQALFESINLTVYKASAKCSSLCTSKSWLLLWIRVFAARYYTILNSDSGYKFTWYEQDGYTCLSKCEKIVIHLFATTAYVSTDINITFLTFGFVPITGLSF